jgi:hypothetical protein
MSKLDESERKRLKVGVTRRYTECNYDGDLLDDKRHGFGIITYENGRSYIGEWR